MKNPRTRSFKVVKAAVAADIQYAGSTGSPDDDFWRKQFWIYSGTIRKAKSWSDLIWRLENAPSDLISFRQFNLESWKKSIEEHTICVDPLQEKKRVFEILANEFKILGCQTTRQTKKKEKLRTRLAALNEEIFQLEFGK